MEAMSAFVRFFVKDEASGDLDGLQRKSRDTASGMDDAGGASGGLSGKLGFLGKAAGIATAAFAAIGLSDYVNQAIQASDATDKFKSTLNFAGLGSDEIEKLTQSTQAYADQTVYSLSDIQNVTAQLAANGVPNYDKLAEAAGNLNAVAGGNADTFSSVAMAMTQTAGAGKLTTENWDQLADAIPGASGKLQEAMLANGAYTGNFRDAMAAGEITAEEFNQAIMDLGMTDVAKEAATSTATIEGAWGNFEATVVGGLAGFIGAVKPAITGFLSIITGGLQTAFDALGSAVQYLSSVFQPLVEAFNAAGGGIEGFQAALALLPDIILGLGGQISSTLPTMLQGAIDSIVGLISTLPGIIGPALTTILPALLQAWWGLMAGLIQTLMTNLPTWAGQLAMAAFNLFLSIVTALPQILPGLLQSLWNLINTFMGNLPTFIQGLLSAALNLFMAIVQALPQILGSLLAALGQVIGSVISNIPGFIGSLISAAVTLFMGIAQAVPQVLGSVLGAVGNLIGQIPGKVRAGASQLVSAGKDMILGMVDGIKQAAGRIVDAAKGVVEDAINGVKSFLGIASPSKVMKAMFKWVPIGMAEGIDAEAQAPYKSMVGVGANVAKAAQFAAEQDVNAYVTPMNLRKPTSGRDGADNAGGYEANITVTTGETDPRKLAKMIDKQQRRMAYDLGLI